MKYTFKRKKMASKILIIIMNTEAFSNEMVRTTPMPISLKETYYESLWYFCPIRSPKATIYLKRA